MSRVAFGAGASTGGVPWGTNDASTPNASSVSTLASVETATSPLRAILANSSVRDRFVRWSFARGSRRASFARSRVERREVWNADDAGGGNGSVTHNRVRGHSDAVSDARPRIDLGYHPALPRNTSQRPVAAAAGSPSSNTSTSTPSPVSSRTIAEPAGQ